MQVSTAIHGMHLERVNERAGCQPVGGDRSALAQQAPARRGELALVQAWGRPPNADIRAQSLTLRPFSESRPPNCPAAPEADDVLPAQTSGMPTGPHGKRCVYLDRLPGCGSNSPSLAARRNAAHSLRVNSRTGPRPCCLESRTPTAPSAEATSTQLPVPPLL